MKHIIKIILVLFFCGTLITTPQKAAAQISISLQVFYDQLSPYGEWVNYPNYGYAWIPSLDETFMPYASNGHWVLTNYGWTWMSDYDWGWAAFHYGRWYYDINFGWIWIPDTQWAPAWVAWGQSSGYYGWTPLGPGINISVNFSNYNIPPERWVFVRDVDIVRPDVNRYYVNRTENVTIIKKTTIIKNTYVDRSRNVTYIAGPNKNEVQKVTGKPIKPVAIEESNKPEQKVNNDKLVIYRPQVKKEDNSGKKPAPPKVVALKDVKKRAPQQENANAPGNNNQKNQQQQKNNESINRSDSNNNRAVQKERDNQNKNRLDSNSNKDEQQRQEKNPPQNINRRDTNNNRTDQQLERKPQNPNSPNNKPDQQPEKKPENVNPQNKPDQQEQAKPSAKPQKMRDTSFNKNLRQTQQRPSPQNAPAQKPKPKTVPQKPNKPQPDTSRRPH